MSGGIPPVALIVAALIPRAVLSTLPYPMKYISSTPLPPEPAAPAHYFINSSAEAVRRGCASRAEHPRRAPAPSTGATSLRRQPGSARGAARHGRRDNEGAAPLQVHHHRRYGSRQVEPHAHVHGAAFWRGPRHDHRSRAGVASRRPVVWRRLHFTETRRLLDFEAVRTARWLLSAQASSSTVGPSN